MDLGNYFTVDVEAGAYSSSGHDNIRLHLPALVDWWYRLPSGSPLRSDECCNRICCPDNKLSEGDGRQMWISFINVSESGKKQARVGLADPGAAAHL